MVYDRMFYMWIENGNPVGYEVEVDTGKICHRFECIEPKVSLRKRIKVINQIIAMFNR